MLPVIAEATRALPALADTGRYGPTWLTAAWLAEFNSANTRRAYFRDLNTYLAWCQRTSLDPFTVLPADITAFKTTLTGSSATINRQISVISSWYRWMIRNEVATTNPMTAVRRPSMDKDDSTTVGLTVVEVKQMLAVADRLARSAATSTNVRRRHLTLRDVAVLRFLADLGLRRDEICLLDLDSLSNKQGYRTLRYIAKGAKRRERPIPAHALEACDAFLLVRGDEPGPLFPTLRSDGSLGRLDGKQVFNTVKRFARAAGLPHAERISPHGLRHAFATNALDSGAALTHVQDAMGHADPRTTRRYDRGRHKLHNDPALALGTLYANDSED